MLDHLLDLLFPERCASCDTLTPVPGLCAACAQALYPTGAACPICALPAERALTCFRCRRMPPPFAKVVTPWRYGGELAAALRRFKYGGPRGAGRPELARALGSLLAPALATPADVIVPVPLHPDRLAERGFAQTVALATAARRFAAVTTPIEPGLLERRRATAVQAGLHQSARQRNVAGAFATPVPTRVAGRRVLLIDDVVTTGATAAACARALLRAGAAEVIVAAVARAELA